MITLNPRYMLFALVAVVTPAVIVAFLVDPGMGILTIIALEVLLLKTPKPEPKPAPTFEVKAETRALTYEA